jgi:energy-coupling factor transporter ATP-binding protein EcfA2
MPAKERPLQEAGQLSQFAQGLRHLRDKAGSPPYRELGRRAHYSAGTLSEAASGRKLPTLAVTLAYVQACEGDTAEWERRWRRLAAELARQPDENSPYLGLAPFQEQDTHRFFGRERLIEDLCTRLATKNFLAVFGPSGAGKSSLLRAGLLPRMENAVLITPGAHPSTDLPEADLLVVDQFEEVFTLCEPPERAKFINALLTTESRVVIGMRSDFYSHCAEHPDLTAALTDAQILVGQMTAGELRAAITQPAIKAGYTVEGDLVAELIAEAGGRVGALPLMSHVLRETWKRRRGNALTLAGYRAAGGIQGALAQTAETLYTSLDPSQQTKVRQLFLSLIALGTPDTKRRIPREDTDPILSRLAESRLITLDTDTMEIAHESLISAWPRLTGWLTDDRDSLRVHRQLTEAAATWESLHRDPGALYRGSRLAIARERGNLTLAPREQEFLQASLRAEQTERNTAKRHLRQLRWLAVNLVILLVAAIGLAAWALYSQRMTAEQRQIALSRQFAAQATAVAQRDIGQAMRLSLEAMNAYPTSEARSALFSLAGRPATGGTIPASGDIALSADGSLLATANSPAKDPRLTLWNVHTHTMKLNLTLAGADPSAVSAIAISSDNKYLVVGTRTGSLRIWTLTGAVHVTEVIVGNSPLLSAGFSPDGTRIVAMDDRKSISTWDSATLTRQMTTPGDGLISGGTVAYNPNGRQLAVAILGEAVELRNAETGAVEARFRRTGPRSRSTPTERSSRWPSPVAASRSGTPPPANGSPR